MTPKNTQAHQRAAAAYIKLMRATDAVTQRIHSPLLEVGLTFSQFSAMEVLHSSGPMSLTALGNKMLRNSSSNVTSVVDNLESRGLARRERNSADRRVVTVSLTEEGHALMESILPAHLERILAEFSVLDAAETEQLAAMCRRLGLSERAPTSQDGQSRPGVEPSRVDRESK